MEKKVRECLVKGLEKRWSLPKCWDSEDSEKPLKCSRAGRLGSQGTRWGGQASQHLLLDWRVATNLELQWPLNIV